MRMNISVKESEQNKNKDAVEIKNTLQLICKVKGCNWEVKVHYHCKCSQQAYYEVATCNIIHENHVCIQIDDLGLVTKEDELTNEEIEMIQAIGPNVPLAILRKTKKINRSMYATIF